MENKKTPPIGKRKDTWKTKRHPEETPKRCPEETRQVESLFVARREDNRPAKEIAARTKHPNSFDP